MRERDVPFELVDGRRVDAHRRREVEAAVHHAMTHADEAMVGEPFLRESHQVVERARMTERNAVAARLLGDHAAVAVLRDEPRRREQRFGLPACDEVESGRAPLVKSENLTLDEPALMNAIASAMSGAVPRT